MEKRKSKNWSVIILMAIGILFVTVAGSIFVSNAWKLMTEEAKEVCLAAVTMGIFAASHIIRKKDGMAITGKALYYLGVVATGFTSYMMLGLLETGIAEYAAHVNAVKVAIVTLLMMTELIIIYARERMPFDVMISFFMFGLFSASLCTGFELGLFAFLLIGGIETLLLSINEAIIHTKENVKRSSKVCSTIMFWMMMYVETSGLFISDLAELFSESGLGRITVIAGLLFAATAVQLVIKRNAFSRVIANVWSAVLMLNLLVDVYINTDIIPNYYIPEFICIVIFTFVVLTRAIWRDVKKAGYSLDIFTFVISCICGLSLLCHNIESENLACVLTLGIMSFIILIWASIRNNRKYQILSGIILGLMAIYLTRAFWLSIAWWVYLLVAGIICIVIAVIKEKNSNDENEIIENMKASVEDVRMDAVEEYIDNTPTDLDFLKDNE